MQVFEETLQTSKIKVSEAIASFWGSTASLINPSAWLLLQVFEETLQTSKIKVSEAIASFWGNFVAQ